MKRAAPFLAAAYILLAVPGGGYGQDSLDPDLLAVCGQAGLTPPLSALCADVIVGLEVFQAEAGMLLAGGNPVLGTASPIGTRFRFIPRLYLGGRINFVFFDMPNIIEPTASATLSFPVAMPEFDVSVGLFNGFTSSPGIGGLLAVELLGSLSGLILPSGKGFTSNATGVGVGTRLGILRESFSAPGISISAMYKWMGRVQFGNVGEGDAAQFGSDLRVLSLRGGISKSFPVLGLAAGLGWDHYASDVDFALSDPSGGAIQVVPESDPAKLSNGRWSLFVDVSYIILFFSIAGEVGWQQSETLVISTQDEVESGKLFASVGVRISL